MLPLEFQSPSLTLDFQRLTHRADALWTTYEGRERGFYSLDGGCSRKAVQAHAFVAESSATNSEGLGLHRGYGHLQADLVPEMLDRVITYCLDVGVRDADAISLKIRVAFEQQLKALGQSLGVTYQTPSTVGMTMRQILTFKGWVDAYSAGIPSCVHVAVEKRRHMDPPPEPPQKSEPVGTIYNIMGPTQINTGSPGSIQTNADVAVSRATPQPRAKKTTVWKYINRLGIVATIAAGAIGVFEFFSHRETTQPPSVAAPASQHESTGALKPPPPRSADAPDVLQTTDPPAQPPSEPREAKHRSKKRERAHMGDQKPSFTFNGPTQINQDSPGSAQNNYFVEAARRLTDDQKAQLKEGLSPGCAVWVTAVTGATGAFELAQEIVAFLNSEGFHAAGVGTVVTNAPKPAIGVTVSLDRKHATILIGSPGM